MYKLKGKIERVEPTQIVSEKFRKQAFVVKTDEQYPQTVEFQLTQDNCDKFNLRIGSEIEVSFNINGREWISPQGEVRVFVTLNAFNVVVLNSVVEQPTAQIEDDPF